MGAVMLPILMAFVALSTDLGFLYLRKRQMQTAADAAAMSAIQEVRRGNDSLVEGEGLSGSLDNGFENGVDGVTVTVSHPPGSGGFTDDDQAVEVVVCQAQRTFFMLILGVSSVDICARSVAAMTDGPTCIHTLNPTDEKTLLVSSSQATLDAECGIVVNSVNPGGLWVESGACLRADDIGVAGSSYFEDVCLNPAYSTDPISPAPITGTPPEPDPLVLLSSPPEGPCPPGPEQLQISADATLNPGSYCKGVQVSNGAQVTLNPGIYVIRGELLDIQGAGTKVSGADVMIYLTDWEEEGLEGKGLKVGSAATLELSGPSSGDYEAIAIYVDRTLPFHTADVSFESGATTQINGAIYAKNQIVRVHSESNSENVAGGGLGIVADVVEVTSSSSFIEATNDFSFFGNGSPLKRPTMVE